MRSLPAWAETRAAAVRRTIVKRGLVREAHRARCRAAAFAKVPLSWASVLLLANCLKMESHHAGRKASRCRREIPSGREGSRGPQAGPDRRSAAAARRGDQGFRRQAGEARAQGAGWQAETEPSQAGATTGRSSGEAQGVTAPLREV